VSAVGHETDYTISDFVADIRAATPSVAGEIVVLDTEEAIQNLREKNKSIFRSFGSKIDLGRKDFHYLAERRFFRKPETLTNRFIQDLDSTRIKFYENAEKVLRHKRTDLSGYFKHLDSKDLLKRIDTCKMVTRNLNVILQSNMKNVLSGKETGIKLLLKSLSGRNPVTILKNGYAIVYEDKKDKAIKSLDGLEIGQAIRVLLADGILAAKVIDKIYKKIEPGSKDENRKNEF
jgi:exodeoxyribonuclease VII large subunit